MLEEVLRYVNNRFERDARGGRFAVSGGELEMAGLMDGQYYWVEGSVMNDGLHRHPDRGMVDEEFDGRVVLLAIPPAVVAIASEIEEWNEANADVVDGPFQSESFGGYSYSRESGGTEGNQVGPAAWQAHFGARLRPYRKLSRDWA